MKLSLTEDETGTLLAAMRIKLVKLFGENIMGSNIDVMEARQLHRLYETIDKSLKTQVNPQINLIELNSLIRSMRVGLESLWGQARFFQEHLAHSLLL